VPRAVLERLLSPSPTEKVLAAAELTAGQLLALFDRPKRWQNLARAGRRAHELGVVDELRRLNLSEEGLRWALSRVRSRDEVIQKAFRPMWKTQTHRSKQRAAS
jgi:hypothetical protein